jgi:hypothetical protein
MLDLVEPVAMVLLIMAVFFLIMAVRADESNR